MYPSYQKGKEKERKRKMCTHHVHMKPIITVSVLSIALHIFSLILWSCNLAATIQIAVLGTCLNLSVSVSADSEAIFGHLLLSNCRSKDHKSVKVGNEEYRQWMGRKYWIYNWVTSQFIIYIQCGVTAQSPKPSQASCQKARPSWAF